MILTGTIPIDCLPQAEGQGPSSQPSLLGEPGLASREATAATPPPLCPQCFLPRPGPGLSAASANREVMSTSHTQQHMCAHTLLAALLEAGAECTGHGWAAPQIILVSTFILSTDHSWYHREEAQGNIPLH